MLMISSISFASDKVYVIGAPQIGEPDDNLTEFKAILDEAYRRSNNLVIFHDLPMKRDLAEANSLLIDGSLARNLVVLEKHPNLKPVPFPLTQISLSVFTLKERAVPSDLRDLRNMKVGVLRGHILPEEMLKEAGAKVVLFDNLKNGFGMLKLRRVDAIFSINFVGKQAAKRAGLSDVNVSKPFRTFNLYHLLHKKHEKIIPLIAKSLKEMYEDGTTRSILGERPEQLPDIKE